MRVVDFPCVPWITTLLQYDTADTATSSRGTCIKLMQAIEKGQVKQSQDGRIKKLACKTTEKLKLE